MQKPNLLTVTIVAVTAHVPACPIGNSTLPLPIVHAKKNQCSTQSLTSSSLSILNILPDNHRILSHLSNHCQKLLIPFSRQCLCKSICHHLPCFTVLKSNLSPSYTIADTMIFDSNSLVTSLDETIDSVCFLAAKGKENTFRMVEGVDVFDIDSPLIELFAKYRRRKCALLWG
ncbi:hypothetical protein L873DRAFT_708846 [Choiromyces venosus 120613-1]|uniref:Uncharacterized protein n=1 Tax=Choiromyces venosus 120613-1 TaxID=1336337 RepID=A0A3N4ITL8_9PEZI|nr:hypothetical protein L873DRAFT_708846 [Choiromyces venosus 120613-1]